MEKAELCCSWADKKVLSDEDLRTQLPSDVLEIISTPDDPRYLDALARTILISNITDRLFVLYEPVIVEIAARWGDQIPAKDVRGSIEILACFAGYYQQSHA